MPWACGRVSQQMETDFYLINRWRRILLPLSGWLCGRGAGCREKLGLGCPPARPVENYRGAGLPSATLPGSPGPGSTRRNQTHAGLALPGAERSLGGGGGGGGGGSRGGGRHWQMCWQLSVTLEQDLWGSPCVTCRNGHGCPREDSEATGSGNATSPHPPPARLDPDVGLAQREERGGWQGPARGPSWVASIL